MGAKLRTLLLLGVLAAAESATPAWAGAAEGAALLAELPPTPAKRRLLDFRARARASGLEGPALEESSVAAIRALDRARQARGAGDEPHARMLDQLGLELVRAAEARLDARLDEQKTTEAEKKASELGLRAGRARTLLEENQASLGRLQARWAARTTKEAIAERSPSGVGGERSAAPPAKPRRPKKAAPAAATKRPKKAAAP